MAIFPKGKYKDFKTLMLGDGQKSIDGLGNCLLCITLLIIAPMYFGNHYRPDGRNEYIEISCGIFMGFTLLVNIIQLYMMYKYRKDY